MTQEMCWLHCRLVICVCSHKRDRHDTEEDVSCMYASICVCVCLCACISPLDVCSAGRSSHGHTSGRRMADLWWWISTLRHCRSYHAGSDQQTRLVESEESIKKNLIVNKSLWGWLFLVFNDYLQSQYSVCSWFLLSVLYEYLTYAKYQYLTTVYH